MATILKKKTKDSPGVIVFTHKERNFFLSSPTVSPGPLKADYLLGVHYGWYSPSQSRTFEDFYMGDDQQVSYMGQAPFKIPLNSRNFTPSCFHNTFMREKEEWHCWDVICVSRAAKFKNLPILLEALSNTQLDALLVVPTAQNEDEGYDRNIVDIAEKAIEKNSGITLIRLSAEHGFMGANKQFIAEQMKRSKSLVLMSEKEGESRVIAEGLCSGCRVVTWQHLQGGGRDFLNETNSVSFPDYSEASVRNALLEVSKQDPILPNCGTFSSTFKSLSEYYSIHTMLDFFETLFEQKNKKWSPFPANLNSLNIRLPAHDVTVPWFEGGNGQTADIISEQQFKTFMEYLNA